MQGEGLNYLPIYRLSWFRGNTLPDVETFVDGF